MNNSTFMDDQEIEERRSTAILFGIFSSLGVILNAVPLILTVTTSLRKNVVNIFVSNLSAADLMLSACYLFGNTFYVLNRQGQDLDQALGCRIVGAMTFTSGYQEFVFPPLLSINRYISLYRKSLYKRVYTKWYMFAIIFGSWVSCAFMPLIFFFFKHTGYDFDNEHCCVTVVGDKLWTIIYWLLVIIPLVVLTDGTMLYCNTKIYQKLRTHAEETRILQSTRRNTELMWFLWADMSLPICFHTIYHVFKFVVTERSVGIRRFFSMLYLINSCLRPILTMTLLRPYRLALKRCLCIAKAENTVEPAPTNDKTSKPGGG